MERKKYKILIADDEYWTREKLRKIIPWEDYGLIFQKPAVDGEDVLQKMEEDLPDIVITDINMPYLNGVELLSKIQEQYPDVVTFVISGYDDFSYVKDSFMSGSINYLIKPVSRIDLIEAVTKALELLSRRKKQRQETLRTASFLQDMELSQLLEKKEIPFVSNIIINKAMSCAGATLILLKIHDLRSLSVQYGYDRNVLSWAVKQRLRSMIQEERAVIFNHVYRSNEFIIVSEKGTEELKALANHIVSEMEILAESPVTLIFSDHSFSIESIYQAYVQTVSLLMTRSYTPVSQILFPKEGSADTDEICNHFNDRQKKELADFLKKGQSTEVKRMLFEDIGLARSGEESWSYIEVRQTVKRVVNFIEEHTEHLSANQGEDGLEDIGVMLDKEVESLNVSYLCELIGDFVDSSITGSTGEVADTTRGTVHQAAKFIREHYFEQLTLGFLAEKYHVEKTYFSRMFRKETGTTLLSYITRVRIDRAKELITEGTISLTEIAFMVGYDDYTYFNKVFRKTEGMSPSDYRKSSNIDR